ncbi:hypothetical protein BDI4_830083 [Burkholderia diffusa]|nr:hypothetical protein BDI4_830083 [Burkholderia diffusa]
MPVVREGFDGFAQHSVSSRSHPGLTKENAGAAGTKEKRNGANSGVCELRGSETGIACHRPRRFHCAGGRSYEGIRPDHASAACSSAPVTSAFG